AERRSRAAHTGPKSYRKYQPDTCRVATGGADRRAPSTAVPGTADVHSVRKTGPRTARNTRSRGRGCGSVSRGVQDRREELLDGADHLPAGQQGEVVVPGVRDQHIAFGLRRGVEQPPALRLRNDVVAVAGNDQQR